MKEPPDPPEQSSVIGLVYHLRPDEATFDPPIDLTIKYDVSLIPEGVAEKKLVVATLDMSTNQWVELESTVDPEADTITAKVSHFSAFAVLAPTRPASFTVTDLSVTPKEVNLGESVSISVLVTNTGDLTGSYELTLRIDNVMAETKGGRLDGGESERIRFSVTPDTAGEHTVNIGRLLGTYEVKAPKAPAAFTTSGLTISPAEVNMGESVTISVIVTNTGDLTGSYEVSLKIDNVVSQTKEVTLAGGGNQKVTFTIAKDVGGICTVDVDGLSGSFAVKEEAAAVVTEEIPSKLAPETNWWLISGTVAGVVAAGFLSYYLVRKRRKAKG